jgi:orotidine-5'-phosphate decarboxylase
VEQSRTGVIVALDTEDLAGARGIIESTRELANMYKVGSILFTRFGPDAVRAVTDTGGEVFLDLKFHDIPNTVRGAVRNACAPGVRMLTIHASGGVAMMAAAREGAEEGAAASGAARPAVLGVTVLTSLAGPGTLDRVLELADDAVRARIDGVVCSPGEVKYVKQTAGAGLLAVVPGIRLAGQGHDDQARVGTPSQALRDGADYIVVGRSVTGAARPREALEKIVRELSHA